MFWQFLTVSLQHYCSRITFQTKHHLMVKFPYLVSFLSLYCCLDAFFYNFLEPYIQKCNSINLSNIFGIIYFCPTLTHRLQHFKSIHGFLKICFDVMCHLLYFLFLDKRSRPSRLVDTLKTAVSHVSNLNWCILITVLLLRYHYQCFLEENFVDIVCIVSSKRTRHTGLLALGYFLVHKIL